MLNSSNQTLLLVEDNPSDEALTVRALKKEAPSANIVIARDGAEAIGCVEGSLTIDGQPVDGIPKLVLLDLKLPKFSGHEVLKAVRSCDRTCDVPVIIFSSSDEASDVETCYRSGANAYVRKPVDYEEYMKVVRATVSYWLTVVRLPDPCSPTKH